MAEQRGLGDPPVEDPSSVIAHVKEKASVQYRIIKKRKQAELAHRILAAEREGDRALLKSEKKKVDNHASALASRAKQEYLVSSFEALVRTKMTDSARLKDIVRGQSLEAAGKDEVISELRRKVALLSGELKQSESARSALVAGVGEDRTWLSGSWPLEFDEPTVGLQHAGAEDGPEVADSALSAFLEEVTPQVQDLQGPEVCKLEPSPWEPLQAPVICERQVGFVKASLKPHEHEESFNPVA